jgi:hypothetical protein
VEEFSGSGHPGNRRGLAPGRISEILALAFSLPGWPKACQQRNTRTHYSNGVGEPHLGAPRIHGECTVVVHKNLIGDLQDSEVARAFRGLAGPAESPLAFLTEQPKDF